MKGLKIYLVKIPQQQDTTMTEPAVHLTMGKMDTKCQLYLMQLRVGEYNFVRKWYVVREF